MDYIVDTWLDDGEAKFPRSIWNHFDNYNARTTNAAESFHSKLNRIAGKPHLNVFALIEVLQTIQNESEIEIQRLKLGGPAKLPPLKSRKLEQKINRLKSMLENQELTLEEYMRAISSVFHLE